MEDKVTVSQIGLKYGIIMGLILVVYALILQITTYTTNPWLGAVTFLLLIVGFVMGHKAYKAGGDGYMSIGQGLGIGMLISLIGGVVSSIFSYAYIKFIDDSSIARAIDLQMEKFEELGYDDAQIEQAMEMAGKFSTPEMQLGMGIIVILIVGFILSLIVSLFTKKANPALDI